MKLKILVGSGRKIGLFTLPFLIAGLTTNILWPSIYRVGGPSLALTWVSVVVLILGIIIWIWSVFLILTKIPRRELITTGPFSLIKHPLYTSVALLVIPWIGFLLNSWLGVFIGVIVYIGSRIYSPEEEKILSKIFGEAWNKYYRKVIIPWI
jgi:protein-S-isoprenylcysteine O-methyltransferase Ste14